MTVPAGSACKRFKDVQLGVMAAALCLVVGAASPGTATVRDSQATTPPENPIIHDVFTADPAPLVVGDTVYLYTGHDEAKGNELFTMRDWLCFSSKDMKTWTPHGAIMRATDFKWASRDAWASQVVERNGKFYFYAAVRHDNTHPGMAIGVAVSDKPTGPFVDTRGTALVTDDRTPSPNPWDDIDPTVLIDDDGTAWLCWGNPNCYIARLKPNMVELDGPIQRIRVPNYTEGPWLHKRGSLYYLTYAAFAHQGMSEKLCYATAPKITGPWTYRGILTGSAQNSYTIHPGIITFRGQSYLFYHNATLTLNGEKGATGRRSVCLDYLYYNKDGTIVPIRQTLEGVSVPPMPPVETARTKEGSNAVQDAWGKPSPGVKISRSSGEDPINWPGSPFVSTTVNPYISAPEGMSFNSGPGAATIAQTFTVAADTRLKRISLFAGDGMGTGPESPLTLALYDLGERGTTSITSYTPTINLFGSGAGLNIAYPPQAPGVFFLDFSGSNQVTLKAGHTYAFEMQGKRGSAPLFWRIARKDSYPAGAAFSERSLIVDPSANTKDFAIAVYGETPAGK